MHFVILGILLLIAIYAPQFWARSTFKRYSEPAPHFPGNGAELARHLLDKFDLTEVGVEISDIGDHYDPESRTVRLSADNFKTKSLTAITVAAHEVGHAVQHAQNHPMLELRSRLVTIAATAEKVGSIAIFAIPIVTAITRAPSAAALLFILAIGSMLISTIVHLVTLPVEWDASFGKALPVLRAGNYIDEKELQGAEKILRAAAFTYVAGSLASLLNLWRWIRVLRR